MDDKQQGGSNLEEEPDSTGRRVVVTAAHSQIAKAIVRRIREEDFDVVPLERGDDLADHVGTADAVLVLDAVAPGGTDYHLALQAVAQSLARASVRRLIAVTVEPVDRRKADAEHKRWEVAEKELGSTGCSFTALRVGLVVGSPGRPAPADFALFRDGKQPYYKRNGKQRVRPVALEDLASIVIAALRSESAPGTLEIEGPKDLTLRSLLETLNPGKPPLQRRFFGRVAMALAFLVFATSGFVPIFLADFVGGTTYSLGILLGVQMMILAGGGGIFLFQIREETRLRALPPEDFLLRAEPPSTLLGVALQSIDEIWTPQALEERRLARTRQRSAWRYSATPSAFWIAPVLVLYGAFVLVVGVHDALVPLDTTGTRLAGLTLSFVGCLALAGGALLLTRWHLRYAMAFVGSLAFLISVTWMAVAAVVLNRDEPALTLIAASYAVVAAVGACVSLWKRGGLAVKDFVATRGQKVLGSVILGGTVVTVSQALYSTVYVSASRTPSIAGTAAFSGPDEMLLTGSAGSGPRVGLPVSLTITNPTNTAVRVFGAYYVVKIATYAAVAPEPLNELPSARTRLQEYASGRGFRVVEVGQVVVGGTVLEGGERVTRKLVAIAPADFDVATVRLDVAFGRDRYAQQDELPARNVGGGLEATTADIVDPSWLHLWTRSTRYVHVVYRPAGPLGCESGEAIAAYVDDHPSIAPAEWCGGRSVLDDYYGINTEEFSAETPVPTLSSGG